jgi:hypothetical protein
MLRVIMLNVVVMSVVAPFLVRMDDQPFDSTKGGFVLK